MRYESNGANAILFFINLEARLSLQAACRPQPGTDAGICARAVLLA